MPTVTTVNKVHRRTFARWVCGSAFWAGIVAFAIFAAVITTVWFLLFHFFPTTFNSLFPVSSFFWLILIIPTSTASIYELHRRVRRDLRRSKLFAKFCAKCVSISSNEDVSMVQLLSNLPLLYVYFHRNKHTALSLLSIPAIVGIDLEPASQMNQIIAMIPDNEDLFDLWNQSVIAEKNRRNIISTTFTLVTAWLFCLSVPWMFWSNYSWYGYFGCLLVQWPLLAAAHSSIIKINYFASHAKPESWFLTIDYERMAKRYKEEIETTSRRRITKP